MGSRETLVDRRVLERDCWGVSPRLAYVLGGLASSPWLQVAVVVDPLRRFRYSGPSGRGVGEGLAQPHPLLCPLALAVVLGDEGANL